MHVCLPTARQMCRAVGSTRLPPYPTHAPDDGADDAEGRDFGKTDYYNGKTENWLVRALQGRRDRVFLMTKVCTHGRSAQLVLRMLEESLPRLQTDAGNGRCPATTDRSSADLIAANPLGG